MSPRRTSTLLVAAATVTLGLAGCGLSDSPDASSSPADDASARSSAAATPVAPKISAATFSPNLSPKAADVAVDNNYRLTVREGRLVSVAVSSASGPLEGGLGPAKKLWSSSARLQPGVSYRVRAVAVDDEGLRKTFRTTFTTEDLTLDQQTYPSFAPLDGETVGVGMPVIVHFDVAVSDRASIEKHLKVTSAPAQPGAFHWISDNEVHWRPQSYWQPGTDVTVVADIDSVPAGNGIFGQETRTSRFHVGRSMVSKVNAQTHQMQVFRDGALIRTIPITTGKEGFRTRSGTKVIVEKFRHKRMNSETVGIANDSAEGYNLDDVEYAMRLTYSGEFVHAAPWSVGSQGSANVSHGCTGMSTSNAGWLFDQSIRGDVVEYTGTDRPMTLDNGYGDWNASFRDYRSGSAL